MASLAKTVPSSTDFFRKDVVRASVLRNWLVFWLPMVVIGVSLLLLEHRFHNAAEEFWNGTGAVDLVAEAGGSNSLRQLSLVALGAMGAFLLLKRSEKTVRVNTWIMLLIVTICTMVVLSAVWAEDSVQSLKRSVIPVLTIVAALGVGKHWQPRQLCLATVVLTMAYLFVGVVGACLAGTFFPTSDYRFTGTLHPNTQGVNCALLCLASIAMFWTSNSGECQRRNWLWLVPFMLGLTFLFLTRSRTATMALIAAIAVLFIFGASRRANAWVAMGLLFLVAAVGIVALDPSSSRQSLTHNLIQMGRQQDLSEVNTLTGRIPIWTQVLSDVAERPFLGYGYGGFWTPMSVLKYSRIHNWEFNHAHSAYFESLLNVGIIGLLLGLLAAASSALSALWAYRHTADFGFLFIATVIIFALVHGVLDTSFVTAGFASLLTMMCISVIAFRSPERTKLDVA